MKSARIYDIPQEIYNSDIYQETSQIVDLLQIGNTDTIVRAAIKKVWLDSTLNGSIPNKAKEDIDKLSYSFWVSSGKHFILSNFPIIVQIDDEEILKLLILPLSPTCMVVYFDKKFSKRNRILFVDDYSVDKINLMMLNNIKIPTCIRHLIIDQMPILRYS